VAIFLDVRMHAIARELGNGNVSAGIRAALSAEVARRRVERVAAGYAGKSGADLLSALGARRASDSTRVPRTEP